MIKLFLILYTLYTKSWIPNRHTRWRDLAYNKSQIQIQIYPVHFLHFKPKNSYKKGKNAKKSRKHFWNCKNKYAKKKQKIIFQKKMQKESINAKKRCKKAGEVYIQIWKIFWLKFVDMKIFRHANFDIWIITKSQFWNNYYYKTGHVQTSHHLYTFNWYILIF